MPGILDVAIASAGELGVCYCRSNEIWLTVIEWCADHDEAFVEFCEVVMRAREDGKEPKL